MDDQAPRGDEQVIGRLRGSLAGPLNGLGALVVPVISIVGVTVCVVAAARATGSPAALRWLGAVLAAPGLAQRSWDATRFGVRALRPRRGTIALDGDELVVRDSWFLTTPVRLHRDEIAGVRRSTPGAELRGRSSLAVVKQDWGYAPNLAIELRRSRRFPEVLGRVGLGKLQLQPISRSRDAEVVMYTVRDQDRCASDATAWLAHPSTEPPATRASAAGVGCLDDLEHASLMGLLVLGVCLAVAGFIADG